MPAEAFIRPLDLLKDLGLKADQTFIHLGSGPGFYLIPAAHIVGKNGKAIGIDLLPDLLSESESRADREGVNGQVRTIRANLENSNGSTLPKDTADFILLANILHQSDPVKILTEAVRLARPSAHICLIEWDQVATPLGPPVDHRLPKQVALSAITETGLHLKQEFSPSPYHYGLLCSQNV